MSSPAMTEPPAVGMGSAILSSRRFWFVMAAIVIGLLPMIFSDSYWRTNLIVCAINVLLAVGLDFVLGYAGQLNLGQSAFYGIGAYASTLMIIKLGMPFWLAFACGVVLAGLAGMLLSIFAVRLRGHYLAIASLVERARGGSPALAASGAEVSAARTRATLAEKAWYPDLTVGAGPLIQTNNRPPGVAATVGLNIPLPWGKEASEQQAATAQLGAAQQRYEATLLDIQSALGEALARLKAARQANALVARKALPEGRAALKSITADYAQGRGDLAAALAAQHRVHDLELKLLQLEFDEQTALAAIERLIGGEL